MAFHELFAGHEPVVIVVEELEASTLPFREPVRVRRPEAVGKPERVLFQRERAVVVRVGEHGDVHLLHHLFPGSFWANPGGDFDPTPSATVPTTSPGQYLWNGTNVTADVQSWVDTPASNFGWILISPEVINGLAKRFASREVSVGPLRPMLTVTWVAPSVTNLGFGCGVSLQANCLPTLGNASFALNLSGANPGSAAAVFLALGLNPSPILIDGAGPCFYDLDVATTLAFIDAGLSPLGPTPTDAAGQATLGFPIPPAPALAGFALEVQALAIGSNLASSNALRLSIAP